MASTVDRAYVVTSDPVQYEELCQLRQLNREYASRMVAFDESFHRYPNIRPYSDNTEYGIESHIAIEGVEESTILVTSAPLESSIDYFFQMMLKKFAGKEDVVLLSLAPKNIGTFSYLPESPGEKIETETAVAVCLKADEETIGKWNVDRRRIILSSEGLEPLAFTEIHVCDWPDKTPADHEEMLALVKKVYEMTKHHFIAHCSAGVGRAGQFVNSYKIYTALRANPHAEIRSYDIAYSSIQQRYDLGTNLPAQYFQLKDFIEYARADILKEKA